MGTIQNDTALLNSRVVVRHPTLFDVFYLNGTCPNYGDINHHFKITKLKRWALF
jgi:hypothetical protein